MSGDGFLTRWSRRKQEHAAEAAAVDTAGPAAADAADLVADGSDAGAPAGIPAEDLAERLKSLPRIEDLTAEHDLHQFMQAWVPEDLRNRALRQMWSVDPSIRDFIAPESERYDFDKPGAMFSHGAINMSGDELRAAAERMLGSWRNPVDDSSVADAESMDEAPAPAMAQVQDAGEAIEKASVSATPAESTAAAGLPEPPMQLTVIPRRHGGAIPR